MAHMAQPWKHPSTGAYYLRRQIPEALRPAFGGKALFKASLKTKDFPKAAQLFAKMNADLEAQFEAARGRLLETGDPRGSQKQHCTDIIEDYFTGEAIADGLDGAERLQLALIEGDRLLFQAMPQNDGMWPPPARADHWTALATSALLFRSELEDLNNRPANQPGTLWRALAKEPPFRDVRLNHAQRIIVQIRRHAGFTSAEQPDGLVEEILHYLDSAPARRQPITRVLRKTETRLRPDMRLLELLEKWTEGQKPSLKTAAEAKRSALDCRPACKIDPV